MLWGCMSASAVGRLTFIGRTMDSRFYCNILQKTMLKSTREIERHSMFYHDNDLKHASKMTVNFLSHKKVKVEEEKIHNVKHLKDIIQDGG